MNNQQTLASSLKQDFSMAISQRSYRQKSKLLSLKMRLKQYYQFIYQPFSTYSLNLFDFIPYVTLMNYLIEQLVNTFLSKLYRAMNQKFQEKQSPTFYFLFLKKQYLQTAIPLHKAFKSLLNQLICLSISQELHFIIYSQGFSLSGQLRVLSNFDLSSNMQLLPVACFIFCYSSFLQTIFYIYRLLGKDFWFVFISDEDYCDYSLIQRHGSDT